MERVWLWCRGCGYGGEGVVMVERVWLERVWCRGCGYGVEGVVMVERVWVQ